ncbi:MAG: hydrogen peroxide-inducible genes activator, partial [Muribaculaceae bacterium]|nr:hydrogen peroxide-inducible genes activator [Muribaculaceae bacterium]
ERNVIRTSDLTGQMLWLLDEGHCFRDQMVKFCSIKSARDSKAIYQLGSMETFMRMVESGRGMTFVPQLATLQMSQSQLELVRSFAIPVPARQIILITNKNFIRETLLQTLISEIQASIPSDMLVLKPTQVAI